MGKLSKSLRLTIKTHMTACVDRTTNRGAFTNDVIILGGGGLEKMTKDDGGGGVGLKMTSKGPN